MLAIVRDAGWPIWPLIAASVIALAIIIERLLTLRRYRILPPRLLDDVLAMLPAGRVGDDVLSRLAANSPLGLVLATGLRHRHRSRAHLKDAMEQAGQDVVHRLERYIGALGTIAAIAPLMGLFGTVIGMIEIFGAYAPAGNDPAQLARGISIALYNTGFGIFLAIPALIFYRLLRARVEHYTLLLEQNASRLVDAIHPD